MSEYEEEWQEKALGCFTLAVAVSFALMSLAGCGVVIWAVIQFTNAVTGAH